LCAPQGRNAVRAFRALKRRLEPHAPPRPGYRPGFLALIDPLVRDRVGAIYAHHFVPEPDDRYADALSRTRRLADWICEPLAGQGRSA